LTKNTRMNNAIGIATAHLRVARPTDQIDAMVRFYRDGLGFQVQGSFKFTKRFIRIKILDR
jgi:hypothetical protein